MLWFQNTLEGEEAAAFTSWFGLKHALLLAELNDVTSGAKVIVGCTHISANHKLPARQTLQVRMPVEEGVRARCRRETKPEANRLSLHKNSMAVEFLCLLLHFDLESLSRRQNAPTRDKMARNFDG